MHPITLTIPVIVIMAHKNGGYPGAASAFRRVEIPQLELL
jgi:hypothetical protein